VGRLLPFRLPLLGLAGPYPRYVSAHVNILVISSIIDDQMNIWPEPFPVNSYNFRHSENYTSSRVKV
jgi:hypothetical protein